MGHAPEVGFSDFLFASVLDLLSSSSSCYVTTPGLLFLAWCGNGPGGAFCTESEKASCLTLAGDQHGVGQVQGDLKSHGGRSGPQGESSNGLDLHSRRMVVDLPEKAPRMITPRNLCCL